MTARRTLVALMVLAVTAGPALAQGKKSRKITMKGSNSEVMASEFGYSVKPKEKYTIAVVVKSQAIPVWQSHIIASKKAGKNLGVTVLDYAPSKADNVEEQKRILEDLVTAGVDCVVLAPANSEAVRGSVQGLIKAGIPVVYDNTMGPSDVDYTTFIGVDSIQAGEEIAKAIATAMKGTGKLLVLEGVPGQSTSDLRVKGVKDYLAKHYPGIQAESAVTNWQFEQGRTVTADYITKWGDKLKAVVSVGGNQSEGAVEAVKAAGMKGVLIGGFDVQQPQYQAVASGDEIFTVSQGVYDQGYLSVAACVKVLNGEVVPRYVKTPISIVTKANLAKHDERPDALQAR